MKKVMGATIAAGAAMLGSVALTAPAHAEVSFNLGMANDYIFRGLDQTFTDEDDGQAFGGADVTFAEQFYAGAWVSNMGYNDDMGIEYDLYAGWKPTLGPASLDLGVIYYGYRDGEFNDYSDLSTFELKLAGSIPVGGATIGAAAYWTPDYAGDWDGTDDNNGLYIEANAAYTFSNKATLSGAIGQQEADDYVGVDSYVTANVGVTYPIADNLSIDGRFIVNDDDAAAFDSNSGSDKLIATIKATF